jgi:acetyltransferase-like isoleucine patch superfamily enzyme
VIGSPRIAADRVSIAPDCEFGEDVAIEADEVEIGPGCRIGFSDGDDFRTPPGVRIRARRVVFGAGVRIGRSVRIEGGDLRLDAGTRIVRHATIRVLDRLHLGAHGTVGEGCEIVGREVTIGQELWMLPQAKIGGGSAFELPSKLTAGHYLHVGLQSMINTARPVVIGHEVGLGTRTNIYTHGAYPNRLQGFPVALAGVEIGDFTWIPGATINPGVRIGRMCVVGVNSLVTKNLPDGCLAAGSPAKVIRENAYPQPFDGARLSGFFGEFLERYRVLLGSSRAAETSAGGEVIVHEDGAVIHAALQSADPAVAARFTAGARTRVIIVGPGVGALDTPASWTRLDTASRRITGRADPASDRFVNELRRYGIRFYSRPQGDRYADWEVTVPVFEGTTPEMDEAGPSIAADR